MSFVFGLFIVLVAAIPALAFAEGAVTQYVILFAASLMLVTAGISASKPDIDNTLQISRRLLPALLFPIVWMLFQTAPIPVGSIEHSIWRSASSALNESLAGHMSIDVGRTIRSMFIYVSLAASALITMILTRDRRRAETALFALSAVTALSAIELTLGRQTFAFFNQAWSVKSTDILLATSALGAVLNIAAAGRIRERYQSRGEQNNNSFWTSAFAMFCCLTGVAVCVTALISSATTNIVIATTFGLATILLIAVIRRIGLGPLSSGLLILAAIVGWGAIIARRFESDSSPAAILRFATSAPAEAIALSQRLVAGASWLGSGVGTFAYLEPIYHDFGSAPSIGPASTVAAIVVEWGQLGLVLVALAAIQLFIILFRGAMRRGRDSYYPAAGAACTAVTFCESWCDTSLTNAPVQLTAAFIIGLGLSQSVGRTSGA